MCTEKNSISENKDIHVHVPTCSNYTHIHETHSFGLVYYTQTVNMIMIKCDLYNKISHACVQFNESENSRYVGFIKADV